MTAATLLDHPGVRDLMRVLDGDGQETRIVGGAVRNALLGAPVSEIDFATTATPDVVTQRCRAARLRVIPTGIEHGTLSILVDGATFEVTTLREDVETDGRHAKVHFGRDFRADALRRDFTINALSLDGEGQLHDYTDGQADLVLRRVRFIGEARQRIREDYLRILRLFRFHATYGEGEIDREAFVAAIMERDGLQRLSRERIGAELMKLLATKRAVEAIADMSGAGLLGPLVGGVVNAQRLENIVAFEHLFALLPDPLLRLASACLLIAEDAHRLRNALRLSNAQEARLIEAATAQLDLHSGLIANRELPAFLYRHGRRAALDGMTLAFRPGDDEAWRAAHNFLRDTPEVRLPVGGADIMARGVKPGPAVGEALKRLQALWIRAGFPQDTDTLARLIDEAIGVQRD